MMLFGASCFIRNHFDALLNLCGEFSKQPLGISQPNAHELDVFGNCESCLPGSELERKAKFPNCEMIDVSIFMEEASN